LKLWLERNSNGDMLNLECEWKYKYYLCIWVSVNIVMNPATVKFCLFRQMKARSVMHNPQGILFGAHL